MTPLEKSAPQSEGKPKPEPRAPRSDRGAEPTASGRPARTLANGGNGRAIPKPTKTWVPKGPILPRSE